MRVVSGLADLDFHVGRIGRDGARVVVESRPGDAVPTIVYIDRDDVIVGLKALLRSPGALAFLLTAPFRRPARSLAAPAPGLRSDDEDINNPWR